MSAFVVGNRHIDLLVAAALRWHADDKISYWHAGQWHVGNETQENELGHILLAENVRSVNHRYEEQDPNPDYIYTWLPTDEINAVLILKACNCYEYQTCETSDWEQTEAHAIVEAIVHKAISHLHGYEEADAW
jgi:hypothetical protein